ncbi:MAG: glucose 1-dehydrogenase [Oscillospiraceae bacterium]|nr:glucose 1-dehydrogenase [Oscillospiraceae bacterium]
MEDYKGKVVIVTGGATGIGRGAALAFGAEGAKVVVVTGRNTAGGEATAQAIRDAGGEAIFVQCDVSDEEQVKAMVEKTLSVYGRLDCAFNNAGIGPDGVRVPFSALTETSVEVWDRTMAVNARGVFLCLKYEIPAMLKTGGGAIVNTASVGGLRMAPSFGAYGPSKAAVIAVTQTAAVEYARQGIRVNAVCPGPTQGTELMKNSAATGGAAAGDDDGPPIPLGKFGQVEDITNAVLWLCSDKAGHITGHALSVDGGMADIG